METTKGIDAFTDWLREQIASELEQQGHVIGPGGLQDDIDMKVLRAVDGLTIQVWMREYAKYLELGVPASSIKHKFAPARIDALTDWAQRRGLSGNYRNIAYAIAQAHSEDGMPSNRLGRMNMKRTGFLQEMEKRTRDNMTDMLSVLFGDMIETEMDNVIKRQTAQ